MTPQELHEYLRTFEVAVDDTPWTSNRTGDLLSLLANLQLGYNYIKYVNHKTMNIHLEYGEQLNLTYTVFLKTKNRDKTWKQWLKDNVGIDDSYARKLRKVAKELCRYPLRKHSSHPILSYLGYRRIFVQKYPTH